MLAESGYRCERCGMSVRGMPTRIIHKNGIASDNRKSNVMIVCMNCYDEMSGKKTPNRAKPQKTRASTAGKKAASPKEKPWWKFW